MITELVCIYCKAENFTHRDVSLVCVFPLNVFLIVFKCVCNSAPKKLRGNTKFSGHKSQFSSLVKHKTSYSFKKQQIKHVSSLSLKMQHIKTLRVNVMICTASAVWIPVVLGFFAVERLGRTAFLQKRPKREQKQPQDIGRCTAVHTENCTVTRQHKPCFCFMVRNITELHVGSTMEPQLVSFKITKQKFSLKMFLNGFVSTVVAECWSTRDECSKPVSKITVCF